MALIAKNNENLYFCKHFIIFSFVCFRNDVVLQLLSKEPVKTGTKSSAVPPCTNTNGFDNANQSSQSIEKKNVHLNNNVKQENPLDNVQKMNKQKMLNDNSFKMRLINKIENWSPSTAKYARLSIFGCNVSISH